MGVQTMTQSVFHTIPGMGSSQFKYPTSAASGAVMNDQAVTNEYTTRLTGHGAYIVNTEDLNSLSGPTKMSKVVVPATSWVALPSGGNMLRRQALAIYNVGPSVVYVSHSNAGAVTEGFPIAVNGSMSFDLQSYHQLYARTASSTADVRVCEVM
jgi:hypothetical protein